MARSHTQTREHVLEVAHDLFYWHGIRATGIDRVAAEAGVAPTTLYRLFASKDDLIAAYIRRADAAYREWFDAAARSGGSDPAGQILAVFDALAEQVQPHQCRGCPFLMTLAEFPDPAHPAHQAAVAMKTWVRARLGELTSELAGPASRRAVMGGSSPPQQTEPAGAREETAANLLADQLSLVMEGVYASAQALGAAGPARRARALARKLLTDPT
ncbi:MAG: TetR/AcrR family transcriptional regulator [Streptosporangiaceae bacterium]|nr:TetR/AcrR family transcriptional regulator [Streptosporangiaceae bacterium]MBV9856935.1 TetR/AcrR family transcriptional regulator [Streptosporangiaceae bacterium]